MAVPVVDVSSVTKSSPTFTVKMDIAGNVGATSSYVTLSGLTIPSVVDGDKVFLNCYSYSSAGSSGAHCSGSVRMIGATSGTVIHESNSVNTGETIGRTLFPMGIFDLTKTTGTTEDIEIQFKYNDSGSSFHTNGRVHSGKGNVSVLTADIDSEVKTTLQIDSIDMVAIGSSNYTLSCPSIGFEGSTFDTVVKTFTPNQMFNALSVTHPYRGTGTMSGNKILYSYTGKKLVMS